LFFRILRSKQAIRLHVIKKEAIYKNPDIKKFRQAFPDKKSLPDNL